MAAGNTYTQIASTTLSSNSASVTLSSIPTTYTDLVLVISTKLDASGGQDVSMQVGNGSVDTGANYSRTLLYGTGSVAGSTRQSGQSKTDLTYYGYPDSTNFNTIIVNLMNYANTSVYKTILNRSANGATGTDAVVSLWRSASAINTIKIYPAAQSFVTGSTFNLYGITAA